MLEKNSIVSSHYKKEACHLSIFVYFNLSQSFTIINQLE